jgi:hypothetical protein
VSRQLKRVPLDFSWPLKTVWQGFINPYIAPQCQPCKGSGSTVKARRFSDEWYGNAPFDPAAYGATPLTTDHPGVQAFARRNVTQEPSYYGRGDAAVQREAFRLWSLWRGQWSHHLIQADVDALVAAGRLRDFEGKKPTPDEVNAWSLSGFGHDAINQWVCVSARCKREGVPEKCSFCEGSGERWPSLDLKKLHDDWKDQEPPAGEGFQLWEDTTEGSPVSPVFETLDDLCAWAEENATTFGSNKATREDWRRMLDAGFVHHQDGNAIFL